MPYERTASGPIGSEADFRVSDSVKKVRSKQTKFAPNLIGVENAFGADFRFEI